MSVDVVGAMDCGTPASVPASCSAVPPIDVPQVVTDVTATSAAPPQSLLEQIEELKQTQKKLKEEKAKVAKEMKNALKRKKRLRTRASLLTEFDLLEVMRMRQSVASATASKQKNQDAVETEETSQQPGGGDHVKHAPDV